MRKSPLEYTLEDIRKKWMNGEISYRLLFGQQTLFSRSLQYTACSENHGVIIVTEKLPMKG